MWWSGWYHKKETVLSGPSSSPEYNKLDHELVLNYGLYICAYILAQIFCQYYVCPSQQNSHTMLNLHVQISCLVGDLYIPRNYYVHVSQAAEWMDDDAIYNYTLLFMDCT